MHYIQYMSVGKILFIVFKNKALCCSFGTNHEVYSSKIIISFWDTHEAMIIQLTAQIVQYMYLNMYMYMYMYYSPSIHLHVQHNMVVKGGRERWLLYSHVQPEAFKS